MVSVLSLCIYNVQIDPGSPFARVSVPPGYVMASVSHLVSYKVYIMGKNRVMKISIYVL